MTLRQTASLFLMARGRGGINATEDLNALEALLCEIANTASKQATVQPLAVLESLHAFFDFGTQLETGDFTIENVSPLNEAMERAYQLIEDLREIHR